MEAILNEIVHEEEKLALVIMGSVAVVWIFAGTMAKVLTGGSRERTKREIAAYIAEGSMSPEQGERILKQKQA